jgi:histidine triad (HIT) family protein
MDDCIFCKIAHGEIPSHAIYEDEHVLAFLDMHPINPGHTLVIPKTHSATFYEMADVDYEAVMRAVKKVAVTINEKLKPKKVGLLVAGWDVPHTHVHVVPMEDYHDLTSKRLLEGEKASPTQEELASIKQKLS